MYMLGIETSCDDTAASVVTAEGSVLSNIISGQLDVHKRFGGVVPENAARAHLEAVDSVVNEALKAAGLKLSAISGFAATTGPGLIGGVMVGMVAAKTLAAYTGKPFYAVNHLAGHVLTARLSHKVAFPYLVLLVSGGHSQIVFVRAVHDYTVLGTTRDDACGECLDKSAKLMGFPFPGGARVDALARQSTNPTRFKLPVPLKGQAGCDFSFAGLKTAMRDLVTSLAHPETGTLQETDAADACCALMHAVAQHLVEKLENAFAQCPEPPTSLVVGGGVGASQFVRARLEQLSASKGLPFYAPPAALCTDNAAMIAWAALEHVAAGGAPSPLDTQAVPRWPLS